MPSRFIEHLMRVHNELDRQINILDGSVDNFDTFKRNFQKAAELGFKHLDMEEKEIYPKLPIETIDDEIMFKRLLQEHRAIKILVKGMISDMERGQVPNIHALKILIDRHHKLEDEFFFPKLDSALSDEEKDNIIRRLEQC